MVNTKNDILQGAMILSENFEKISLFFKKDIEKRASIWYNIQDNEIDVLSRVVEGQAQWNHGNLQT